MFVESGGDRLKKCDLDARQGVRRVAEGSRSVRPHLCIEDVSWVVRIRCLLLVPTAQPGNVRLALPEDIERPGDIEIPQGDRLIFGRD
ncbi:MAG: hypothetical protein GDA56_24540 [Hormoscilla sp. GM7CHS1pb]|nr:hypothetical protein [Hormoscilla sp. GM7CHS1pb]